MNMETLLRVIIASAITGYIISALLGGMQKYMAAKISLTVSWSLNAVIFILNWVYSGYFPLANMYQVMIFLGLCFMPLFYVLMKEKETVSYFAAGSAVFLTGALIMYRDALWDLPPALRSVWFIPHILSYMIAYSTAVMGFIFTMISIEKSKQKDLHGQSLYDSAAYRMLRFSFPFMTSGLFIGAIWAEEAWGRFWAWDTKETWSLITWVFYLIYLHCQRYKVYKKYSNFSQAAGFISLIITFIFVNLLPKLYSLMHGYAR